MFGGQQLGPQVLQLVEAWVPQKAYRSEKKFQTDLKDFLEAELSRGGGMFGQSRTYAIRKERGKSRADLTVNDEVGIELKREVRNSSLRRLRDQIHDYRDEYPYVIICACGFQETGKWNELKQEYEGQQSMGLGMSLESTSIIRFVEKVKDGRTFRSNRSRGGLRGGDFDLGLDF